MEMTKIKQITLSALFVLALAAVPLAGGLLPDREVSVSERRPLTQLVDYETKKAAEEKKGSEFGLANYFSYLEDYLLDQFPGRDAFRSAKAVTKKVLLGQKDNNDYYYVEGTLCKMDPKLSEAAVSDSLSRLMGIYEKYFVGTEAKMYYSILPDKNYFTAGKHGYLHYDYEAIFAMADEAWGETFTKIDVLPTLSIEDYYRTDPHWDQTKILDTADALLNGMNASPLASAQTYEQVDLPGFRGTYLGQAALPVKPDILSYLTNDVLSSAVVYNYETGKEVPVYNDANFANTDPYDVYLEGATPMLKITNGAQNNGRQLVVFRDSFGSSMVPLLVGAYEEVLVLDIRYVSPSILDRFVQFRPDCDVLMLYSTSVLNSIGAFMK